MAEFKFGKLVTLRETQLILSAMSKVRDIKATKQAFDIQCHALASSSDAYDNGSKWEALRLATTVYTLVYDRGKNQSLLSHIGARSAMKFLASGRDISNSINLIADTPLVLLRIKGGEAWYEPRLCNDFPTRGRWLPIGDWWDSDLIFRSGESGKSLTRQRLVLSLRNQEGGSHFDAELKDPTYIEMAHGKTWIVRTSKGTQSEIRQLELATMRQVAWELLESIRLAGLWSPTTKIEM